jgi:adhesin transport system membrane fusion protein
MLQFPKLVIDSNFVKDERFDFSSSNVIPFIFLVFLLFFSWSYFFQLDQFVRAQGTVFSKARIQVIQSVDGGVLAEINVREGEIVYEGQTLARVDQSRFEASLNEIRARIEALSAKIARLKAEVTGSEPQFPSSLSGNADLLAMEYALFQRRLKSLNDDTLANNQSLILAKNELEMVESLGLTGDVDQSEILRAKRAVIDASAKLNARKNAYFEESGQELSKAEDELAQNLEIYAQRKALLDSSVMKALVPGVVKNIKVTTIGAVLKAGEPLMEIVPIDDELLVEVKIAPKDIADVKIGDRASLKFDAYDSSVYGSVEGTVIFISADTITEDNPKGGKDIFYRSHVAIPQSTPITSIGASVNLIPGMTSQADIKTGKRSVLTYLLKPIVKTLDNSFGEK